MVDCKISAISVGEVSLASHLFVLPFGECKQPKKQAALAVGPMGKAPGHHGIRCDTVNGV